MKDSVVSQRIIDSFAFLCITDTKFLKTVHGVVKPAYFKRSTIVRDVVKLCYDFFGVTGAAPRDHLHDELVKFLEGRDRETQDFYLKYLVKLQEMDTPNKDYILSRINKFIQAIEFEDAAVKFIDVAKEGKFEEAKQLMQKALRAGIPEEEEGFDLLNDFPPHLQPEKREEVLMPLGIPLIDNRLTRKLRRTDFVCVLGGFKGKKSWACIHLGLVALEHGNKVLHISHELSEEETASRYYMGMGEMTDREEGITEVPYESFDAEGNISEQWLQEVDSIYNLANLDKQRKALARNGGVMRVKKYSMGTCTMGEINRYLDWLETYKGFVPDVVINDYIEKMFIPGNERRNDYINDMYIQSKAIADERKLLMITASQVNRAALSKAVMDQGDAAEDIRKVGNVDLMLGISQSKKQHSSNVMQAWVMANRHRGGEFFGCSFNYNLNVGQLVMDCWPLNRENWG
jgi:hypothetical protein